MRPNASPIYERHAAAWADARLQEGRRLYERGWLERFRALVPQGGSILDIGCGAGAPIAKYFAELGHTLTGVDASAAMAAMFHANLPSHQVFIADMRRLSLAKVFHGILAWDSFFHLSYDDQRRMFPIFRAHAGAGAALMFTSGCAHGEAIGRLEGEPLYHASLAAAEYRTLLDAEGFALVATLPEDPDCGGRTVWLAQLR